MKFILALLFLLPCSLVLSQDYENDPAYKYTYGRLYNEADYYYKLKQLNRSNRIYPKAPTAEQLKRMSEVNMPPRLTEEQYSQGEINWPEFFLMSEVESRTKIDRAMAGKMSFIDGLIVRDSVQSLKDRLYRYRHVLTGNERSEYRRFLEGLEAHKYYMEKK